jgi:DNA-directed RNA polymerase subunit M
VIRVKNEKDSMENSNKIKRISDKIKYCPTCGSTKIFWASGLPQIWSIWECKECGYRGPLVLEDGKLEAKLRKEWEEKLKKSR